MSYPGSKHASRVTFRDSLADVSTSVHGVRVSSLPFLLTNLLFRMGGLARTEAVSVIRANSLDEAFRLSLPQHRRATYLELLNESR